MRVASQSPLLSLYVLCIIPLAALGNAPVLTPEEYVRLVFVVGGLLLLWKYYRQSASTGPGEASLHGASFLGLGLVFVLAQFDPAYANISRLGEQGPDNWFFLSTTAVVLGAFILWVARRPKATDGRKRLWPTTTIDWVVLAASGLAACLLLLASYPPGADVGSPRLWAVAKLGTLVLAYVVAVVSLRSRESSESLNWLWRAYWYLMTALVLILLYGGLCYARSHYDNESAIQYIEAGEFPSAVELLENALDRSALHPSDMLLTLGHAYLGTGEPKKAEAQFAVASQRALGSADILAAIGDQYRDRAYWSQASELYQRARQQKPDSVPLFHRLAEAYLYTGQLRNMLDLIKTQGTVPELRSASADKHAVLGLVLIRAGMVQAAEVELSRALELDPKSPAAQLGRGKIHDLSGQYEEALHVLQQAATLDGQDPAIRFQLGVAWLRLARQVEAEAEFQYTIALDPDHQPALGQLVGLYQRQGRDHQAIMARMGVRIGAQDWQGPNGGNLAWGGNCWSELNLFPGEIEISIVAGGSPASGVWPIMSVALGGTTVGVIHMDSARIYRLTARIEASTESVLSISFLNDSTAADDGDRNLLVGETTIRYLSVSERM